mgnify:CR=1 FL=1
MKNYIDEIYTVAQFIQDNPALAEQANRALQYLKEHNNRSESTPFVLNEVDSYNYVAKLVDEVTTYAMQKQ